MNKTIKELLKPPFWSNDEGLVLDAGGMILLKAYGTLPINDDYVEQFQELARFTADALNEKYERDFSEPMRWVKDSGYHYCPKCKTIFNDEKFKITPLFEYCPSCAQKLKPPEEV